jgi:hypothetical protein
MDLHIKIFLGLLLITLFSYVFRFGKKEIYVKMVIVLMILWGLTTLSALCLVKYAGFRNNLFVFHIATPLEFTVLCILYKSVISNAGVKRTISVSVPIFILFCILFSAFIQFPVSNNSYEVIIESVTMVFLSLYYLREVLLLQQVNVLHRFPMFWISIGILFYFTGILLIEGMLNYLIRHSMELARRLYLIENLFQYLLFLSFITGAYCSKTSFRSLKKITN